MSNAQTASPSGLHHTLPAKAYVSPELYEREMREIFARSWALVCHERDVAEPGQYFTAEIAGEPVIILRDAEGRLRALSNVCRHRASALLRGSGRCEKVIRCPYHGWSYHQDGRLAGAAEARGFTGLQPAEFSLPSFPVGTLGGFVFAALDPGIEPLETWFGDLAERLAPFRFGELVRGAPGATEHPQNWKVVADNFLEGYHVPIGHPGLFRLLDYKKYRTTPGRHYSWVDAPLRDAPSKQWAERIYQRLGRARSGYPIEFARSWNYVHLWPATFLNIYPEMMDVWQLQPSGVRFTRAVSVGFQPAGAPLRDRVLIRLNDLLNNWVQLEDNVLCEGVQRGLEGRTYTRGILNRCENGVLHFHDMLRSALPELDEAAAQVTRSA